MRARVIGVCVAACVLAAALAAAGEATVPVTKVTAFSSGVAYFELNGKVTGEAEVVLKFKTDQINDLLKSLVVLDLGGGDVGGVNYASRDPLTRALKSFGVDISAEPTLGQLLKQVRGAEVHVAAPDKITGKILGVEVKTRHILPSNTVVQQEILALVTAEGIKCISLDTITSITLADEKLNGELQKALELLATSRDGNTKPVAILFHGQGERPVRIGYISEAPVWRTSYRLVLADEKKDQVVLQGWAIVENTSDFDWDKVDLTLVSGRPISFIQDLYTALYVPRPVVQPELYASLRPQQYDEGLKEEKAVALRALDRRKMPMEAAAAGRPMAAMPPPMPGPGGGAWGDAEAPAAKAAYEQALQKGVESVASAKAVGELFSYRIKTPVSLQRRKSAMLPIVNQTAKARKVSIYNAAVLAGHPLNGLWLTNDTGLSLLAGPVTVFDAGTYAGDAQLGNLAPSDKRLLSYAIDLKVTVDPSASSSHRIVAAKIVRGVLQCRRKQEFTQTYLIKNKADQERVLLVEHPFNASQKLLEPAESLEKTPTVYRFETKVPAATTGKFVVREERVDEQAVEILPTDVGSLQWYVTNGEVAPKVREALAEAIRRKGLLAQAERELADLNQRIGQIRQEQTSVRANMGALDRASQGFQRFEKKLLDLETLVETIQRQVEDKRAGVTGLRRDLEEYVGKLDVE